MNHDIEFHRRSLAKFYYVTAALLGLLGVVFLIVACVDASAPGSWSDKGQTIAGWTLAGFPLLLGAAKMWTLARAYTRNFIRLDATGVTFQTLGGKQLQIPYLKIQSVDFDSSVRKRVLTIKTAESTYTLDQRSSPSIGKVAKLLQDRIGTPTG